MKTALITGGTSGIGLATAALLRKNGYRVAVTGSNAEPGEKDDVLTIRADARSLVDSDRVAAAVGARFGSLDLLFLNAGIVRGGPIEGYDEATFDDLVAVNFKGQFFTLQKVLPLLNEGASVVFTVGIGATRGVSAGSAAAGSRGALLGMIPSLALELAPRRITVNAVSPGAIDTELWTKNGASPEVRAAVADRTPLGRFGTPDEVAEVVAFLGSPGAAYITGENIVIGGGAGLRS